MQDIAELVSDFRDTVDEVQDAVAREAVDATGDPAGDEARRIMQQHTAKAEATSTLLSAEKKRIEVKWKEIHKKRAKQRREAERDRANEAKNDLEIRSRGARQNKKLQADIDNLRRNQEQKMKDLQKDLQEIADRELEELRARIDKDRSDLLNSEATAFTQKLETCDSEEARQKARNEHEEAKARL